MKVANPDVEKGKKVHEQMLVFGYVFEDSRPYPGNDNEIWDYVRINEGKSR